MLRQQKNLAAQKMFSEHLAQFKQENSHDIDTKGERLEKHYYILDRLLGDDEDILSLYDELYNQLNLSCDKRRRICIDNGWNDDFPENPQEVWWYRFFMNVIFAVIHKDETKERNDCRDSLVKQAGKIEKLAGELIVALEAMCDLCNRTGVRGINPGIIKYMHKAVDSGFTTCQGEYNGYIRNKMDKIYFRYDYKYYPKFVDLLRVLELEAHEYPSYRSETNSPAIFCRQFDEYCYRDSHCNISHINFNDSHMAVLANRLLDCSNLTKDHINQYRRKRKE